MNPTEEDSREALFEPRWPQEFSGHRCGHEHDWHLRGHGLHACDGRHYQSSLTAGAKALSAVTSSTVSAQGTYPPSRAPEGKGWSRARITLDRSRAPL